MHGPCPEVTFEHPEIRLKHPEIRFRHPEVPLKRLEGSLKYREIPLPYAPYGEVGPCLPPAASGRRPLPLFVRLLVLLVAVAAMVAFAAALAQITLQPSPASEALTHTNLRPGRSLRAYLDQPELRDAAKQIGGNILLGVPFGILLPVVLPGAHGILRVIALTAVVMMLVELVQGALVTGRAFDIDDVLLNVTGATAGYLLLGRRMGRAVHPAKR